MENQNQPKLLEMLTSLDSAGINLVKAPNHKPLILRSAKSMLQSFRAGDWVCLRCSNLNFAFRTECNRCQKQTKKENFLQNISRLTSSNICIEEVKDAIEKEGNEKKLSLPLNLEEEPANIQAPSNQPKERSNSFESCLLLTPEKGSWSVVNDYNVSNSKEETENRESELKPYKSPSKLPSISPILKTLGPMTIESLSTNSRKPSHRKDSELSLGSDSNVKVRAFNEIEEDNALISRINTFVDQGSSIGRPPFLSKSPIIENFKLSNENADFNTTTPLFETQESLIERQLKFWKNLEFSRNAQ